MSSRLLVSIGRKSSSSCIPYLTTCRKNVTMLQYSFPLANKMRFYSVGPSITYSGGQATEGQGGFYGSGGARASIVKDSNDQRRPEMLALAADVQKVEQVMMEVDTLDGLLQRECDENEGKVNGKIIEIKSKKKKILTSPEFMKTLSGLEVKGEPTWGLSSGERELITMARQKVNEC